MRKASFFLCVFLIVTLVIPLYVPEVKASPSTETLYVNGFNSVNEQWTEAGDSPWLSDSDANYIYTKTDEYWHEDFTFANSDVGSGTINSVYLYMELKILDTARADSVEIYIHDGSAWSEKLADWNPSSTSYYWKNVDISLTLDSWTKIDAGKLKIKYDRSGSPSTAYIYVRRAYLYVDYTVGEQDYSIDLTKSFSATFSMLYQTNYQIPLTFTPTTTFTLLHQTNYLLNLIFSPSTTFTLGMLTNYIINFAFQPSVCFTLDIFYKAYEGILYVVDLLFTPAITFTSTFQTTYNILLGFIPNVAFTLNAMAGYFVDFIFQPTVTFTLNIAHTIFEGVAYYVDLVFTPVTQWTIDIIYPASGYTIDDVIALAAIAFILAIIALSLVAIKK